MYLYKGWELIDISIEYPVRWRLLGIWYLELGSMANIKKKVVNRNYKCRLKDNTSNWQKKKKKKRKKNKKKNSNSKEEQKN